MAERGKRTAAERSTDSTRASRSAGMYLWTMSVRSSTSIDAYTSGERSRGFESTRDEGGRIIGQPTPGASESLEGCPIGMTTLEPWSPSPADVCGEIADAAGASEKSLRTRSRASEST